MSDPIERIIACARKEEIEDQSEWIGRHESQAEGDLDMDEVNISGGDAFCVAYEPGVDLDVTWPENQRHGDDIRETLLDLVFKGEYAGVSAPARVGCDRLFNDKPGKGMHRNAIGDPYWIAYTTICMPPEDFLRIQYQMSYGYVDRDRQVDMETWLADTSEETIEGIQEEIRNRTREVPRPVIECDRDGQVIPFQEGRHRGIAAQREGIALMDVYIMANYDTTRGRPVYEWNRPPRYPH